MTGAADDARALARLQALFDAALERPPAERDAYLAAACGGDAALHARVARLLAAAREEDGDDTLVRGAVRGAARDAVRAMAGADDHAGRRLGAWRLIREIGHGGMGTVWLAERDATWRARGALKLVRGGFASDDLARRFRDERQILADLNHPHIAALLDGGEAPDGTPYLVMEYVEGEPLSRWIAGHGAPLAARLRLFRLLCDAVQHAHAALVVHRDIKPSNVVVAADGTPKLLDFGIAKLLGERRAADTTALSRRLTPGYASPEQLRGERVTVATDVWSLGVLLYELLAGVAPFSADDATVDEVRRRVLDVEPPRPSDVLRRRGDHAAARRVAGDLDTIVAKAMRKEAAHRYASVQALADDVDRMLAGRPVLARPASLGYRARKFVRRHAAPLGAAALVFLALAGGLATTRWQARRAEAALASAEAARLDAESALSRAAEVQRFLVSLFRASDPNQSLGAEVTARELLARGEARVDELAGEPALQADLLETLARVRMALGEYRVAHDLFDREVRVRRTLTSGHDSLMLQALNGRGQTLSQLGRPDSAAAAFEEAVAFGRRTVGEDHGIVVAAMNNLAITYARLGRDSASEAMYRAVVAADRRTLGPDAQDLASSLGNLGLFYAVRGRHREAEVLLRDALRIRLLADSAAERPSTAFPMDNLAMTLREAGRYDEAEPLARRALALRRRTLGPDHRFTAESYFSLGLALALRGGAADAAEADSLLHAALDVLRASLGDEHRAVAYPLNSLGVLALRRGDPGAAEAWLQRALAIRRGGGDAPRETARTLVWLGHARLAAGADAAAARAFHEADSLARASLEPGDPVRSRAAIGVALALARGGDTARAAPLFRSALATLGARIGAGHPLVREACAAGRASGLVAHAACG